jgi:pimeloyl-ACP methyl ester carboxylesterase
VGFSLGALVAMRLAIAHPQAIRSLTLVSAVADRSPSERQAVRDRLARTRDGFEEAVDAALDRWFSTPWRAREPELAEQVRTTLLANDRRSYVFAYAAFAEADAELWPALGRISVPTLAVTGSDDAGSTPAMTRALAGAIPGASGTVVDGARHLLPLERPDALMDLILEHLRRTDANRDRPEALPALHRR